MNKKRTVFTLENVKLSSMGSATIVYILRALINHKIIDPNTIYNVQFEVVSKIRKKILYIYKEILSEKWQGRDIEKDAIDSEAEEEKHFG